MRFLAYTLEYKGGPVSIDLKVRCYSEPDYKEYKHIYEECFYEMRKALGLPRECCKSPEELKKNKNNIYIIEENNSIIGSVSVYGNEIDDLFVAKEHQKKRYGVKLLRFAVSVLQKENTDRIILHVADVNKAALSLYLKNDFTISSTEEIMLP